MKSIYYFGGNPGFGEMIKNKLDESFGDHQIGFKYDKLEKLCLFNEVKPLNKLIILDLSPWDESLLPEILYPLKILEKLEIVLENQVIVLTGEEMSLQSEAALAANHLVMGCYTKGEDLDIFFNFICRELALETSNENPFAKLNGLSTEIPLKIPFLINNFKGQEGNLEMPIAPTYSELETSGSFLENFRIQKAKVSSGVKKGKRFHYPFYLPIKKDFLNPNKDEIKESLFVKFLDRNQKHFKQKHGEIALLGQGLAYERYAKILDLECQANVHHLLPEKSSLKNLKEILPEIIFMRVFDEAGLKDGNQRSDESKDLDDEKGFTFDDIIEVVEEIKKVERYDPILIVMNSPSASAALRDAFEYEKILGFPDELSREFLLELIDKFNAHTPKDFNLDEKITVKENSPFAAGWFDSTCIIHSLSESHIEFSYEGDIFPGTWVHLTFPFDLSLLILEETPSLLGGAFKKYNAKIMGLYGLKENKIRVLINLAYEEPKEFFDYYIKHPKFLEETLEKHTPLKEEEPDENEPDGKENSPD